MGSMLYDIIKYQASTEGFQGNGRLTGIDRKLKVIRQRFLKLYAFWSERVVYQDGEVDFVIFVFEEKLKQLQTFFDESL